MKGLRIIPLFLFLISLSYAGSVFVDANSSLIEIQFLKYQTPPLKAGLVVLLSAFAGTVITGLLCSVEILALYVQNRRLRSRLRQVSTPVSRPVEVPKRSEALSNEITETA